MLNLLRFRNGADYSAFPEAAPSKPVSSSEADASVNMKVLGDGSGQPVEGR
jgi:hypothetical protein